MAKQGRFRTLVALLAVIGIVMSLSAGCSQGQQASPTAQATTGASKPAGGQAQAPQQGEVVVRFVGSAGSAMKSWTPQIEKFNEKYKGKIRIEAESEAKDPLLQKLITQFISGTPTFDVVSLDGQWSPRLQPYLEPLDPYLKRDGVDADALYGAKRMELLRFDKGTVALPLGFGGFVLFYRKDMFEQAGVKVPTSLEEYLDVARKLTKKSADGKVEVYGTGGLRAKGGFDATATLSYFLLPSGGRIIAPDGKGAHPGLKEPYTIEVLRFLKTIVDEGLSPNPLSWDQNTDRPAFAQGRIAMSVIYNSISQMVEDPKESVAAGKVGYAVLKLKQTGPEEPAAYANGWSLGIDKNSKVKDAAWEFIKWMTSFEAQKAMAISANNPPTPVKVLEDPEYQKMVPSAPALKEILTDYGFDIPTAVVQGTEVEKVIHEEMQLLFLGKKTPEQVADSLYTRIDQEMKR